MGNADRLATAFITTCFIVAIGYILFYTVVIGTVVGVHVYRVQQAQRWHDLPYREEMECHYF